MKKIWISKLALTLTLIFHAVGFGSIPPSEFIIKTWVNKHVGIKEMRIRSHLTIYDSGTPLEPSFQVTTLFDGRKGSLEVTGTGPGNQKVFGFSKGALSSIARLLFDPNLSRVVGALKGNEIPVQIKPEQEEGSSSNNSKQIKETTEFARSNRQIYWVIGNHRDLESPQLWLEKDLFTPSKLRVLGKEGWREVALDSVRYFREFPILRNLQLKNGKGELILREEILEVHFSDSGFKPVAYSGEIDSLPSKFEKALKEYEELLR